MLMWAFTSEKKTNRETKLFVLVKDFHLILTLLFLFFSLNASTQYRYVPLVFYSDIFVSFCQFVFTNKRFKIYRIEVKRFPLLIRNQPFEQI